MSLASYPSVWPAHAQLEYDFKIYITKLIILIKTSKTQNQNSKYEIEIPKKDFKIQNSKFKIQNSNSKTQKAKIKNQNLNIQTFKIQKFRTQCSKIQNSTFKIENFENLYIPNPVRDLWDHSIINIFKNQISLIFMQNLIFDLFYFVFL